MSVSPSFADDSRVMSGECMLNKYKTNPQISRALTASIKTNGVNYYGLRNFLTNGFLERNHYTTNALDLNETLFQNFAKLFIR